MMNKHKWYNEIVAWAMGCQIEACRTGIWFETDYPEWHSSDYQFRIKQQPVEVVASGQPFRFKEKKYLYAYIDTRFGKIEFSTEWDKTSAMPLLGKIEVQDD